MKARTILLGLLSWMMTASAMAEERSTLFVNLADGSKVTFVLPIQKPTVTYEKSVMTIVYNDKDDSKYVKFLRDEVKSLEIGMSNIDAIDEAKKETDSRITFDLTRPGVVSVSGLQGGDRLKVFDLQGKVVKADISRYDDKATVDLSALRRGIYMVSVNQRFTFKLMKP